MATVKLPSGEVIEYASQGGTAENPVYYNTKTITQAPVQQGRQETPINQTATQTGIDASTQAPVQTIGDAYNTTDKAITEGTNYYGGIYNAPLKTEAEIFEDKRKLYQGEIDAVNKIYSDKIQSARIAGQGRLGSSTASQARSGLLGSDFGQAQTETVKTSNQDVENAYLNEQSLKISEILGKARTEAVTEAEAKRKAKEEGATKYIEFLTTGEARKKSRVTDLAKSMIAKGVDIKTMSDAELSTLASTYGVSKDSILATYNTEKLANDNALADLKKNEPDTSFTLSQGQERFVLDPKTGQYTKVASTAKTYAPKATGTAVGGISQGTKYSSDLDAVIGATVSTIPSKFGQQTFLNQISKARNDGDKLNLVASQVLKGASAETRNDFSNQAIAMKQLDKAIAELDSGVKTGFLNSKAQYVAGIFGKDFDPKLQKVQAYITSAVQPYRNSVTGAAWGSQEDGEYADLFGSIKYSPTELKNRLLNMKETLKSKSATALNTFVNPLGTYGNQFETGQFAPTTSNNPVDKTLSEFGL